MEILLFMLGSITIFQIISQIITTNFPLNKLSQVLITGLLDLTSGISLVPTLNLNKILSAKIMLFFITFGSFSVHIQVINAIRKTDLSYMSFLIGRIMQSFIAIFLFTLFQSLY